MLEDRDVHTCNNRRSSRRAEVPLQAAEIVVQLRRPCRTKHESRSFLENALDLRVKSVAASDPLLRFKERAVRRVDLGDRDCSAPSRCPNTSSRFLSINGTRCCLPRRI